MLSFLQYITELFASGPVDVKTSHPDEAAPYPPVSANNPVDFGRFKYKNAKTGVTTEIQYLPSRLFSNYPQIDPTRHKRIADVQWLVKGSMQSTGKTDATKTRMVLNTVWDHLRDHAARHTPDAAIYNTEDPVRHSIYQTMARRLGIPAFNLGSTPEAQPLMSRKQRKADQIRTRLH